MKKSFFKNNLLFLSYLVGLIAFFFVLSFGIFLHLDKLISWRVLMLWTPILNNFFIVFSQYIFDTKTLIVVVVLLSIFLFKKHKDKALLLFGSVGVTAVLSEGIKYLFHHARPVVSLVTETSFGFPSSHASISLVFFSVLIFIFKDNIKNNFKKKLFIFSSIFLVLLIGFSRIYLNAHYLSDVLAGYVLGAIVFILSIYFFKKLTSSH